MSTGVVAPDVGTRSATELRSCAAVRFAMSAASFADSSRTTMSMMTVSSGALAFICCASLPGVVSSPSWLITGARTTGCVATCAYEFTSPCA
jgi:hypothetical protein